MPLLDVNGEQAKQYISYYDVVVVDFWAEWCIPCKAVDEALRRLSEIIGNPNRIAFIRVNIEDNPEFAAEQGVFNLPTVIVFSRGTEIERLAGNISGIDVKIYKIIKKILS